MTPSLGPPPRAETDEAPEDCTCEVCGTFELLGQKWTTHVLGLVYEEGPLRFNELKRRLGGVSARMLSDRLDELAEADLVERVDHDESPPRVEYRGTERGEELVAALEPLVDVLLDEGD